MATALHRNDLWGVVVAAPGDAMYVASQLALAAVVGGRPLAKT